MTAVPDGYECPGCGSVYHHGAKCRNAEPLGEESFRRHPPGPTRAERIEIAARDILEAGDAREFEDAARVLRTILSLPRDPPPFVSAISRLRLRPEDVVVVRLAGRAPSALVERITEDFKGLFPGVRVLILDDGADLEVLRAPPPEVNP